VVQFLDKIDIMNRIFEIMTIRFILSETAPVVGRPVLNNPGDLGIAADFQMGG